jgi:hypothetical protein
MIGSCTAVSVAVAAAALAAAALAAVAPLLLTAAHLVICINAFRVQQHL